MISPKIQRLNDALVKVLGERLVSLEEQHNQLTLVVRAEDHHPVCMMLRDAPELRFQQATDLCGVDYSTYGDRPREAQSRRFAAVLHLLSVEHNWRLRLRVFCPDDDFPMLDSVIDGPA